MFSCSVVPLLELSNPAFVCHLAAGFGFACHTLVLAKRLIAAAAVDATMILLFAVFDLKRIPELECSERESNQH